MTMTNGDGDGPLSWDEACALAGEEHVAIMAFARERRDRIYRLYRGGMTPQEIARQVGGLAPYRVRRIIAWAERSTPERPAGGRVDG